MAKKRKKRVMKRVPASVTRFMKRLNPAMRRSRSVRIEKLNGGAIKITPNPERVGIQATGRYRGQIVDTFVTSGETLAKAKAEAKYDARSRIAQGFAPLGTRYTYRKY